jgi:hypothetical protein
MEMLNTSHRYSPVKRSENAEVRSEIGGGGRQWQLVTIVGKTHDSQYAGDLVGF